MPSYKKYQKCYKCAITPWKTYPSFISKNWYESTVHPTDLQQSQTEREKKIIQQNTKLNRHRCLILTRNSCQAKQWSMSSDFFLTFHNVLIFILRQTITDYWQLLRKRNSMKLRLLVRTINQISGIVLKKSPEDSPHSINVLVKEVWTSNCVCRTPYRRSEWFRKYIKVELHYLSHIR